MRGDLMQSANNYNKEHVRQKRWRHVVTALACVVVFCTTYALILPAIAMTGDTYCGKEEHKHTQEECYERVLICGYEETGEAEAAHEHTDECYETRSVLVCGQEEQAAHTHSVECYTKESTLSCGLEEGEDHTHDDSCYTETETLTCGLEETEGHTHDDSCYQEERVLICEQEETETAELPTGHVHTDACYEEKLVCQLEEHEHSLICYSNPEADVESAAVWERTLPQNLGANWAENVVAVANSQIGYMESTANYTVLEDGATMKGYTRYGAWYGMPYDDWCAMFASFCLHYAGVPETSVPYASGCIYWIEQLQSAGLYESAAECFPEPGFLIFFDSDSDGYADHVGIVTEVAEDGETISTVEGNIGGAVVTQSYSIFDSVILGYGVLPENPDAQSDATDSEEDIALAAEDANAESTDLTAYLNSADIKVDGKSYQEGTTLPASKEFSVELSFTNIKGKNDQTAYSYTLPAEISIPQDITDGVLKDDNGVQQGTYTVTKDAETGRTVINVAFYDDYVKANDYINLALEVTASWNIGSDGEHEIDFGNDHIKKITVDGTAKLSIDKTHTVTSDDRNADYSIVVTAATDQQNVQLSDSVSYAEISYTDADGVQHTEQIGAELKVGGNIEAVLTDKDGNSATLKTAEITDQDSLNTFLSELKLDMKAGETLTINYPMEYPAATALKADAYTKYLHTYNTAGVKSDAITDELTAEEEWAYYGNQKRIVEKTAELSGDSAKWELVLNYGANYPMAGTLIYDVLQSDALSYDTAKSFVIEVYAKDETLVRTDELEWSDILQEGNRGWNYTIPSTDGNNQYVYVISYYTNVDTGSTGALNNAAGARFSQYPEFGEGGIGIGTQTDARKIDIEIQKEGQIVDEKNRITEWTIKYMVLPGSGQILDFWLLDYMPSYTVNGETKYAKLIKNDGTVLDYNDGNTAIDSSGDGTGSGEVFSISISSYLNTSGRTPDYTADDFQKLLKYCAYYWYDSGDLFAIVDYNSSKGLTLPAAVGDYADGYVVTIKYRTKSESIEDGGSLTNKVGVIFRDLLGQYQWLSKNAKVTFPMSELEDSVTMDKTGSYDPDSGKVHYTVNVDTRHVGFSGADYVAITDHYDDRLDFQETMYYIALGVPGYTLPNVPVYLKSVSESLVITEQVETPEGFSGTTWKTTYPQLDAYAMNEKGEIEKVSNPWIYTILDREHHTFTLYLPYSYMWYYNGEYFYLSYTLDYDLSVSGDSRSYNNVQNTVTAIGSNGIHYGQASTTFSFAQLLTTKTLNDSAEHEHSGECYTYDLSKDRFVLTCPLTATDKNKVLFKVRVNIGASDLQNMTQLIIDDYMDSSKLTPDIENLQLRFVDVSDSTQSALSFDDACTIAGVTGAYYKTELTQSGLTVTVNLGQKDGQNCSVKDFCDAFNLSDFGKKYELNLSEFKLELSYPAKVNGSLGETVTVKNQANLRGVDSSGSEVVYDKVIQGSSGSVSGQSYTINLWKIDAVSTGGEITPLPNAHFNLCDESGNVLASAITDADGKIVFGAKGAEDAGLCNLSPYTAYYLIETEAPDGYVLNTTKHWFYFTAPDGTDEQKAFTEEEKARLEGLGCVPMSMDSTLQVYNSRTVSFNIKKADDETLELLTGAEFTLYSDEACKTAVQTSRTSGDGIYQLDGLELGTTYYLKETKAPEGYVLDEKTHTVTVDSSGAITIDDLTWKNDTLAYVYTNTKQTYVLPETGGAGTLLFTIGGTLLLAGSLLSGYVLRRKRERRVR